MRAKRTWFSNFLNKIMLTVAWFHKLGNILEIWMERCWLLSTYFELLNNKCPSKHDHIHYFKQLLPTIEFFKYCPYNLMKWAMDDIKFHSLYNFCILYWCMAGNIHIYHSCQLNVLHVAQNHCKPIPIKYAIIFLYII